MEEKYIKFYKTFHKKFKNNENLIHCFELLSDGGVISNSELKRRNYGGNGNTGFCIWTNSICSNRKTNKDFERKKNSRRELQRGIMHCSKTLCYC
jgi:hypothetical protein